VKAKVAEGKENALTCIVLWAIMYCRLYDPLDIDLRLNLQLVLPALSVETHFSVSAEMKFYPSTIRTCGDDSSHATDVSQAPDCGRGGVMNGVRGGGENS